MKFSVYVFAWDIAWRGPREVASELSRAGVGACHAALVYHAVSALCPDAPAGALFARPEGRFYFTPSHDADFGGLVPAIDELAASNAMLVEWSDIFAEHGIELVPWIVPTHDMAGAPAGWCQVGPLGDRHAHVLCPGNPAVGDYVGVVVGDLRGRAPFPIIELEHVGFGTFDHWRFAHHPKAATPAIVPEASELLSLCFCQSCESAASRGNVDVDALRTSLAAALRGSLGEGTPPALDGAACDALDHYRDVRRASVLAHVERVRGSAPGPLSLSPLFPPAISGFDPARCLGDGDEFAILGYGQSADGIGEALDRLSDDGVAADTIRVVVELSRTDIADVAAAAAARGVENLSFYNYGLCSAKTRRAWAARLACLRNDPIGRGA